MASSRQAPNKEDIPFSPPSVRFVQSTRSQVDANVYRSELFLTILLREHDPSRECRLPSSL